MYKRCICSKVEPASSIIIYLRRGILGILISRKCNDVYGFVIQYVVWQFLNSELKFSNVAQVQYVWCLLSCVFTKRWLNLRNITVSLTS